MTSLYRERSSFERELLAQLRSRLKGSGWKLSQTALYREIDGLYLAVMVSVHRNARLTTAELRIKPMQLDELVWRILGMPENDNEPLWFRTWGAFTCSGLPIHEESAEREGNTPAEVAEHVLALCQQAARLASAALGSTPFSSAVVAHPNQVARGAYAVTLVATLIAEQKISLAEQEASSYASGAQQSCSNLSVCGVSFHKLALEWLASSDQAKALGFPARA